MSSVLKELKELTKFHTSKWEDIRDTEYGVPRFWCSTESTVYHKAVLDLIRTQLLDALPKEEERLGVGDRNQALSDCRTAILEVLK